MFDQKMKISLEISPEEIELISDKNLKEILDKNLKEYKNRDEEHEIVEQLFQKLKDHKINGDYFIMTNDKKNLYDIVSYMNFIDANKLSPDNAYVYILYSYGSYYQYGKAYYHHPILFNTSILMKAYLSKMSFYEKYHEVAPANGLKYIAIVTKFTDINEVIVEVADINTVAENTNLSSLIRDNKRDIDYKDMREIQLKLELQRLFYGYSFIEATQIINNYYYWQVDLQREVENIKNDYKYIFKPYRIIYNLKLKSKEIQVGDKNK